jgi:hypothetical protein
MQCGLFQENIHETHRIASSLLPAVREGTARVVREVISQLMEVLSEGGHPGSGEKDDYDSWTHPRTRQERETSQCQRHRSLDTFFPLDSSANCAPSRPLSALLPPDDMQMDAENMIAAVAGSNEARKCVQIYE